MCIRDREIAYSRALGKTTSKEYGAFLNLSGRSKHGVLQHSKSSRHDNEVFPEIITKLQNSRVPQHKIPFSRV